MKRTGLTFICIFFYVNVFSSAPASEFDKTAHFIRVWGFLKYFHPEVASGKFDWDNEFKKRVHQVSHLDTKEALSNFYLEWIKSLGKIKEGKKDTSKSFTRNLDLHWLSDTNVFKKELVQAFTRIQNSHGGKNTLIKRYLYFSGGAFKNEKPYKDSIFPASELRLLCLARYWNIINYFYPYKYLIDQNWNEVLDEMVPKFRYASDTVEYNLAILELITRINDSHGVFYSKYVKEHFGNKSVPFKYKIIEDKAVVLHSLNDSLSLKDDIQRGDVILKINNTALEELIKGKLKYTVGSNMAVKYRNLFETLFNGNEDSIKITFERNGLVREKIIRRCTYKYLDESKYYNSPENEYGLYKVLKGNIGYVNLGLLRNKQVNEVMDNLMNTRAIIFDLRGYPKGTLYALAKRLNKEEKEFVKLTVPDLSSPGLFNYIKPYTCGKSNPGYYKGKILILINEETQSHAEFSCMALQTAPDVTVVGSQTSGADGDVISIVLPGGYRTYISGAGVYYPDGRETQRIGIIPDIRVTPTIEGIKTGRDEILEKALQVLN